MRSNARTRRRTRKMAMRRKIKTRRVATRISIMLQMKTKKGVKHVKGRECVRSVAKWHMKKTSEATVIHHAVFLPLDIVANILSRLPVRLLIRLRCVCKQWCSLTHSPYFIGEQYRRGLDRYGFISRRCVSPELPLADVGDDGEIKDRSFPLNFGGWHQCVLSNTANGLVCGYRDPRSDGTHYLLNPSIRQLVELPRSDPRVKSNIGLAFDSSTGKYKLVRLFVNFEKLNGCSCQVLTVGTSEWRDIGDFPCSFPPSRPVFLNGALHWVVFNRRVSPARPAILLFDVKNEKFQFMPTPKFSYYNDLRHVDVLNSGGPLLFVKHPEHYHKFRLPSNILRIWVLRDYKTQNWTQEYKIDMTKYLNEAGAPRLIGINGDKVLLLWLQGQTAEPSVQRLKRRTIYSYDPHARIMQELRSVASPGLDFFKESLVSPRYLTGNQAPL